MMRRFLIPAFWLVAVLVTLVIAGCSKPGSSMTGSGKIIDQNIRATDFTHIIIQGNFVAEIHEADIFNVVISTDDNLMSRVLVSSEGEILRLKIQAPATFFPTSLKTRITLPRIYGLTLSGGAKATISGFRSTFNFSLNVAEKSSLTGQLEAGISEFDVSESSQVTLKGSALELKLQASGESRLDLGEFIVNNATVSLKEGTEAIMHVNGRFDVVLNDASRILYLGNPTINEASITGGSVMRHK